MSLLETQQGFAVTAGLSGVTLAPLVLAWVFSFRSITRHIQAVKIANVAFRIALPLYILGVILYTAYAAVVAAGTATLRTERLLAVITDLLLASGVILFTVTIYLTALAALYVALGRQKWWSWMRLDTLLGAGLLFILLIAYWAMRLSDIVNQRSSFYRWRMPWLLVVIDVTLSLMSIWVIGVAIYALPKLNKRKEQIPVGKMPVLLVIAAFLWAVTVLYGLAVTIKNISDDWEYEEQIAQLVISPLLGPWVTGAVALLLHFILHNPAWSDPAATPSDGSPAPYQPQPGYQPQMAYQQPYEPGFVPQQYPAGYQQQVQQQYPQSPQQQYPPQVYQQPQQQQYAGAYQQPQQQQFAGGYQQPQQASPSPVTQTPPPSLPVYAHEVDANQNPHVTVVR
ncbi:hypothetical protein QBC40DRAFT_285151 [Triangularia verruculosa]|uniref:Uncharacterized protein n=1 Tax=Triangularia verruculosa TaxID=2587418 RepID=A0AAN7AU71_9PEZI|nr:hypothetical protein QBC40DRAFT_285151 [Triangularia verruculosa]